jgi:hypothetical protein
MIREPEDLPAIKTLEEKGFMGDGKSLSQPA